ncbi:hypothetical protein [Shewanella algae]|uniref:phosphoribosyltransferase-like protein n=1 Tax=Shewanella algae TaxID=38313 RepID=UPI001BF16309|nr:hypothetical protein [Shewanella algae]BCV34022.1 hypothetical protein TUM4442_35490 [Shewanella algae]
MKPPIPIDAEKISERIFYNARKLIEYNYWDGIKIFELLSWINNFKTEEEKYFASSILLSIIYRNRNAIRTFGAQLFQITIPNYLEDKNILSIKCLDSWLDEINSPDARSLFPFRFSTIEGVDNKPAKSGAGILRALKREFFDNSLSIGYQSYDKLKNNSSVNTIILLDDILGTGEQFDDFIKITKLNELGLNILYCPFAANTEGLDRIRDTYDKIDVLPVEILEKRNGLFSEENKLFHLEDICRAEEFKIFYHSMCKDRDFKIDENEFLGKGNLALTYLFNDSTPNNNIAALWYGDKNWKRLVKR